MSDTSIFIIGLVASILCFIFAFVTINEYRKM